MTSHRFLFQIEHILFNCLLPLPLPFPPPHQHQKPTEEHEIISLDLVNVGDILEVRSGELIPADGIIVDGFGALDKAPLTGESAPVEVEKGD